MLSSLFLTRRRRLLAWSALVILALLLLALGLGCRDPWPADEPRFALNAIEMLVTGDFWIPHRGGELYADKPPIFMWASALSIWLTDSMRIGFLLPSLLAGIATLALCVDLTRRLYGQRIAWLSGIALLASLQFVLQAKTAQIDMLLTFFTTLGAYGLMRHALLGPARGWWRLGFAAMGAGVLTKGVGFLPLALLPAWWWLAHRGQLRRITGRELLEGIACMVGVVLAWGLPMLAMTTLADDPSLAAYRDNILFKQTGQRYANAWAHLRPWHYYLSSVIPWAWLPLVLTLPWAVPAWYRRLRRQDARLWLPLSGVVLIVLFFSLSPGKRGVYVLPALPLLCLSLAPLLPGLVRRRSVNLLGAVVAGLLGAILVLVGVLGLLNIESLHELARRYSIAPWWDWSVLGALILMVSLILRPARGVLSVCVALWLIWGWWSTLGYQWMDPVRSPRAMMAEVAQRLGPNDELGMIDFTEEALLHSRVQTVHFGDQTPVADEFSRAWLWLAERPEHRWLLMREDDIKDMSCGDLQTAQMLGWQNREYWLLVPGTAFIGCPGDSSAAPLYVAPTSLPGAGSARYF